LLSQYSVWLRAGRPGVRGSIPGRDERIFFLASLSRSALRPTRPPVQWVPGVLSLGRDADHSPSSIAEVENEYELYLLSSPSGLMACSGTALAFYTNNIRTTNFLKYLLTKHSLTTTLRFVNENICEEGDSSGNKRCLLLYLDGLHCRG
jgi:hypothetical protein